MANLFSDIEMLKVTCAHELMHLQFHYYFEENLRKTITKKQFKDIKEALTILLNIEFKDILKKKDLGYPNHKNLRDFIEKQWKKKKDFDILLDKCVNYLKNN